MFIFSVFDWKYLFWEGICFKKSELSVEAEIYHLDKFENVEFNGDLHFFFFFGRKYPFWVNLVQKIKIVTLS